MNPPDPNCRSCYGKGVLFELAGAPKDYTSPCMCTVPKVQKPDPLEARRRFEEELEEKSAKRYRALRDARPDLYRRAVEIGSIATCARKMPSESAEDFQLRIGAKVEAAVVGLALDLVVEFEGFLESLDLKRRG